MKKPYQEGNVFYACGVPIVIAENEKGETHVYRASDRKQLTAENFKYGTVYGGGRNITVESTSVTMESGFLHHLYGGCDGGEVTGKVTVVLQDGEVGEWLCGGGTGDLVGSVDVTIKGGVAKYGVYCAGQSLACGDVNFLMEDGLTTRVFSGGLDPEGVQTGRASITVTGGGILMVFYGGEGHTAGEAEITITGGRIEERIDRKNTDCPMTVRLDRGVLHNKASGELSPSWPQDAKIFWTDAEQFVERCDYKQDLKGVLDRSDDAGKLVFRFFELRHPDQLKGCGMLDYMIGDCILVDFPSGERMLIDTGSTYSKDEVFQRLRQLGVKKLDYFLITHYHIDHFGNAKEIIRSFPIGEVILPDMHVEKYSSERHMRLTLDLFEAIVDRGIPARKVSRGQRMTVGSGAKKSEILFLNPSAPGATVSSLNRESIAMKISYKKTSAVLGGDIIDFVETAIVDTFGDKLKCDLLKVSHHGITKQTHYRYVEACDPTYCVTHNTREEGVFYRTTRYSLNHIHHIPDDRLFVTGTHGLIKATLDGKKDGVTIKTQYIVK